MTPEREKELRPDGVSHINPGMLVADLTEALDAVATFRKALEHLASRETLHTREGVYDYATHVLGGGAP